MGINLYEVLGVDKNASADEIKEAYRNKAKENHPDKEGGDHEKMTDIVTAYGVLKDEKKRDRYDKTGEVNDVGFEVKFQELVNFAFLKVVEENDVERVDLVKELSKYIGFVKLENKKSKVDAEKKYLKLQKVNDRLSAKGDNRIGRILEMNIYDLKRQISGIEDYLKFLDECLEVVNHHSYKFDAVNPDDDIMKYFLDYKIS